MPLQAWSNEPAAERRAAWLVANAEEVGEVTKGELGELIGLRSKAAITDVVRRAERRIEPEGMAITQPNRGSDWRLGATADAERYVRSLSDRTLAIIAEIDRWSHGFAGLAAGENAANREMADRAGMALGDVVIGLGTLVELATDGIV